MLGKGTAWIEDLSLQELLVRFDKCLDIECTGGMHGYIHGGGSLVLIYIWKTLKLKCFTDALDLAVIVYLSC